MKLELEVDAGLKAKARQRCGGLGWFSFGAAGVVRVCCHSLPCLRFVCAAGEQLPSLRSCPCPWHCHCHCHCSCPCRCPSLSHSPCSCPCPYPSPSPSRCCSWARRRPDPGSRGISSFQKCWQTTLVPFGGDGIRPRSGLRRLLASSPEAQICAPKPP